MSDLQAAATCPECRAEICPAPTGTRPMQLGEHDLLSADTDSDTEDAPWGAPQLHPAAGPYRQFYTPPHASSTPPQLYFEPQVLQMCAVHALNMFLGYPAVTPAQMLLFRQHLADELGIDPTANPSAWWATVVVIEAYDITDGCLDDLQRPAYHALSAEDVAHDPEGRFTGDVLSVWCRTIFGYHLCCAPGDGVTPDMQPSEVEATLDALSRRHSTTAFLACVPGHMFALQWWQGAWYVLAESAAREGPLALGRDDGPPPLIIPPQFVYNGVPLLLAPGGATANVAPLLLRPAAPTHAATPAAATPAPVHVPPVPARAAAPVAPAV